MSEMIERAVQALHKAAKDNAEYVGDLDDPRSENGSLVTLDGVFDLAVLARSVLAAIREPTEALVLAACRKAAEEQVRPVAIHRTDAADLWQAMIDEALK